MDKELHRIAITGIIYNNEGKYLITKRSENKKVHPGRWHVPGGGMSTDDYTGSEPTTTKDLQWYNVVEKVLKREIKEEVGLDIEKSEYVTDLAFIRPDNIPVLVLSYMCKLRNGEVDISNDPDTVDFAWVTLEEAKTYDLVDGILEEIEMVDKILKER